MTFVICLTAGIWCQALPSSRRAPSALVRAARPLPPWVSYHCTTQDTAACCASNTDGAGIPQVMVAYKDNQALAEYLVTFRM